MAIMGRYCKAYPIEELRRFEGWTENSMNYRREVKDVDGQEVEVQRTRDDIEFLYLQEDFVVTDSIYKDENVIFEENTPTWLTYCREVLEFSIPDYCQ